MKGLLQEKYGRLTPVEVSASDPKKLRCICDCGAEKEIARKSLISGSTRSCGCLNTEKRIARNIARGTQASAIVGVRFGRLVVIEDIVPRGHPRKVVALCDCGNRTTPSLANLRRGDATSCGCSRQRPMTEQQIEARRAYHRKYYDEHPEKYSAYSLASRVRRIANADTRKAESSARRLARKEKTRARSDSCPQRTLVNNAKARAKHFAIPFEITVKDAEIPPMCPICGTELRRATHLKADHSPSIDRIVPALGYVPGNICVICNRCNTIKSNGTLEDHLRIAAYMARMGSVPETRKRSTRENSAQLRLIEGGQCG